MKKTSKRNRIDCKSLFLIWAIMKNKTNLVKLLIEKNVDINKKICGFTPIECACIYQNSQMIKYMVEAGCKLNYKRSTICHILAEYDQYNILKELVKRGLDVNKRDCSGRTGLHWAAEKGNVQSVSVLLSSGANVDAVDGDDMTPLIIACIDGNYAVVVLLINYGANINYRDREGHTPLFHAKARQRKNIQRFLLMNGADN